VLFSARSTTEATVGHLETAIITRREETVTGQVRRKGNAWNGLDSSGTVHMEFIPEGATVNKHRYKEILRCLCSSIDHKVSWALVQEELAVAIWKCPCTSPCACSRGAGKIAGHHFATTSILVRSRTMWFLFLSAFEKRTKEMSIQSTKIITATREPISDLPANIFRQCFQQLYQCW
jgi:hypothetical protein